MAEIEGLREEGPKEIINVGIDPSSRSQKTSSIQDTE
jgi:hypothetical protein